MHLRSRDGDLERGFVLKGYQITPQPQGRILEYRQVWYCVPVARAPGDAQE